MTMFPKYEDWLNEDLGKGKPSPIVNDDLEDIRLFKGSVAQLNDWLNKKLEDQNKTWNPYADMQYKHPVERSEKDNSIGYQDYKHGKDTHPENAKATRRRGSKVDPAKFTSSLDEARQDKVIFSIDDGKLDDEFLGKSGNNFSKNLDYHKDGNDTYYVLPRRDFDRFYDWADSSRYDVEEIIIELPEGKLTEATKYSLDRYKKEVAKLFKNKKTMDDQQVYDDMIVAFSDGVSPAKFVSTIKEGKLNEDRFGHPITALGKSNLYTIDKMEQLLSGKEKNAYMKARSKFWKITKTAMEDEEQKINEAVDSGDTVGKQNADKMSDFRDKVKKANDTADKARSTVSAAVKDKDADAKEVAELNVTKAHAQATIVKVDAKLFKLKLAGDKKKAKEASRKDKEKEKLDKEKEKKDVKTPADSFKDQEKQKADIAKEKAAIAKAKEKEMKAKEKAMKDKEKAKKDKDKPKAEKKKDESYVYESFADFLNEKLARGLKPLLKIGSDITKKAGEDALLDLSDKFDRIDDEYAGTIASWLDMAIELMQDGYSGDATKKLKQFNKACKDVLNGKDVGSAFE